MASIRKYALAKGYAWRVQYRDAEGRSRQKRGFRTKGEAEGWAAKNAVELNTGEWVDPSQTRQPLGNLWPTWYRNKRRLAESSQRALESSWRTHVQPRWGATPLAQITPQSIQDWIHSMTDSGSSPTTVHRAYSVLNGLLSLAVRNAMIPRNPAADVVLPSKKRKKLTTLTPEQVDALADAVPRLGTLVTFLGYTGARWSEATALTVGDIDLDRARATINKAAPTIGGMPTLGDTKTRETRTIALPPKALTAARGAMRGKLPAALLWPANGGGYLTTPSKRSWFHAGVRDCMADDPDFPRVTPHDLRHAAASMLISQGHSVLVVQRQLGHSSAKRTLDIYSHLFDADLDAVSHAAKMQPR